MSLNRRELLDQAEALIKKAEEDEPELASEDGLALAAIKLLYVGVSALHSMAISQQSIARRPA